ncbi:MAG: methyltransferase domain-containing protein, partial [Cyanobacteria bacterium P01_D01_bin.115]
GIDIEFYNGSVYDLSSYGKFDFSFCGALLEHLKDPIGAIEQLFYATEEKAIIACSSSMSGWLTWLSRKPYLVYRGHQGGGSFFEISEHALKDMCQAAGFRSVETVGRCHIKNMKSNSNNYHVIVHAYK